MNNAPILSDDEIVSLRKDASGGRFGKPATTPWADSLAFGRAVESAVVGKLYGATPPLLSLPVRDSMPKDGPASLRDMGKAG